MVVGSSQLGSNHGSNISGRTMFSNSFSNCNNNSFSNTFRWPPKSSQELLNCIIAYVMCKQARIQAVTSSSPRHPSSNPTGLSPAVDPPRTPKTQNTSKTSKDTLKTLPRPCQDSSKTSCVCVLLHYIWSNNMSGLSTGLVDQHVWSSNKSGRATTCLVEQHVWSSNSCRQSTTQ